MPDTPVAIAVDPGREKCGLAAVGRDGTVALRRVVPTCGIAEAVRAAAAEHPPAVVLVGDGTGSAPVLHALRALGLAAPVEAVPERGTSEEARRRYTASVPARGLQRLLPRSLRAPPEAYDDWVAVILAERWWASARG